METGTNAEPWTDREDWSSWVIYPQGTAILVKVLSKSAAILLLVTGLVMFLLLWLPLGILGAVVCALILVGAALLLWTYAWILERRWQRIRESRLELDSVPGIIGGSLRGELILEGIPPAWDELTVGLRCIEGKPGSPESPKRKRGRNPTSERTLTATIWRAEQGIPFSAAKLEGNRTRVPVSFLVPYFCLPSRENSEGSWVCWEVNVATRAEGKTHRLSFSVPVFRTEQSDPSLLESPEFTATVESDESPAPRRLHVTHEGGIPVIRIAWRPSTRQADIWFVGFLSLPLILLVIGEAVGWMAAGATAGAWLFVWLTCGSPWRAVVLILREDSLTVRSDHILWRRTRRIPWSTVRGVEPQTLFSDLGTRPEARFNIDVVLQGRRNLRVANSLKGNEAAEWLRRRIGGHLPAIQPDQEEDASGDGTQDPSLCSG